MTIFMFNDSKIYCFTLMIKSLRSSETPEGEKKTIWETQA